MKSRAYFISVTVGYLVACVIGVLMFKSPGFSSDYLVKHGDEHKRYLKIIKSKAFELHEERPELHPATGALHADAEFVEHYRENPEFEHEEHRIAMYVEYFRVVNSVVFLMYLWGAVGGTLLSFLDARIADIRTRFEEADSGRASARARQAEAEAKLGSWPQTEAQLRQESEAALAESLAKVREEDESAARVLEKQTEDRKHAELLAAAETIRLELVEEAIRQVEESYRTKHMEEKLALNVDSFTKLLERMT